MSLVSRSVSRILVLGDDNVGKSSLITALLAGFYDPRNIPELVARVIIPGSKVGTKADLCLIDTQKEDLLKDLNSALLNEIEIIVICLNEDNYLESFLFWKKVLENMFQLSKQMAIVSAVLLKSDQIETTRIAQICKEIQDKFPVAELVSNVTVKVQKSVIDYFRKLIHCSYFPAFPLYKYTLQENEFSIAFLKAIMTVFRHYDFKNSKSVESGQIISSLNSKKILLPSIQSYVSSISRNLKLEDARYSIAISPMKDSSEKMGVGLLNDIVLNSIQVDCFGISLSKNGWKHLRDKLMGNGSIFQQRVTFYGLLEMLKSIKINRSETCWNLIVQLNMELLQPISMHAFLLKRLSRLEELTWSAFAPEGYVSSDKVEGEVKQLLPMDNYAFVFDELSFDLPNVSSKYEISPECLRFLFFLFYYPLYDCTNCNMNMEDLFTAASARNSLTRADLNNLLFPLPSFLDVFDLNILSKHFICANSKELSLDGFLSSWVYLSEVQPRETYLRLLHLGFPFSKDCLPLRPKALDNNSVVVNIAVFCENAEIKRDFLSKFNDSDFVDSEWIMRAVNVPKTGFVFHDFRRSKFLKMVFVDVNKIEDSALECYDHACILLHDCSLEFLCSFSNKWQNLIKSKSASVSFLLIGQENSNLAIPREVLEKEIKRYDLSLTDSRKLVSSQICSLLLDHYLQADRNIFFWKSARKWKILSKISITLALTTSLIIGGYFLNRRYNIAASFTSKSWNNEPPKIANPEPIERTSEISVTKVVKELGSNLLKYFELKK